MNAWSQMCLDKGLSHYPAPDCKTHPSSLLHSHAVHWLRIRLCAEPAPVLPNFPYTHDCSLTHNNNLIIKFSDDTTVPGLISKGDKAA